MKYDKQEALMTKGMAILLMVILHLFFRERNVVLGTPLLWFNSEIPVVYWFGFYGEVCVTVYSVCMGYAQYMLYRNGKVSWKMTGRRILRIMINYWIILAMFSVAGLIYNVQNNIPGSLTDFLKSIVLLHSYNAAWWYLNSYVLFLLIPSFIKFFPADKLSVKKGLVFCVAAEVVFYLIKKSGFWSIASADNVFLMFVFKEVQNLLRILPATWVGALFYKGNTVSKIYDLYYSKFSKKTGTLVLALIWSGMFVLMNVLHKSVFNLIFGVLTFLIFNIWKKSSTVKRIFLYLGKHSTNIWLSHVFFYMTLFTGLVEIAVYPLFILAFTLFLSILTSYIEMAIEYAVRLILAVLHLHVYA